MLFPPIDPNERFRARRAAARRRKRLRRAALIGLLLGVVTLLGAGAQLVGSASSRPVRAGVAASLRQAPVSVRPRPLPIEVRGVHVSMVLASFPGKLGEYLDLTRQGLTALEVDVKDEHGEVAFSRPPVALARTVGAARDFYIPRDVARRAHSRGVYLIGRVVVFEDPKLAEARPGLAVRRRDGTIWRDGAGFAWTNPFDRRVWSYNVAVAAAAARAGFDEIMFDYVRFPSDGEVETTVYPHGGGLARRDVIPAFLNYAERRLARLDVRVSAAVFGLSATRDLGIGQLPRRMAAYLDAVYPMTYPSLFGAGELGLDDPSAIPETTVARSLAGFRQALRGRDALLVPWVQDFSFSRRYGLDEVRAQIEAARLAGAKGFLLWNPQGHYTEHALAAP